MPIGRCCGCNGAMAICRNCRCAKNRTPCVSCYPSRKGKCENCPPETLAEIPRSAALSIDGPSVAPADSGQADVPVAADPSSSAVSHMSPLMKDFLSFQRGSVLDRVPKGARNQASLAFNTIIRSVCETDTLDNWRKLFRFSPMCFKKP